MSQVNDVLGDNTEGLYVRYPRLTDVKLRRLERIVMAHRYLYYVLADPILKDWDYDKLDKELVDILNEKFTEDECRSPVLFPGSDLKESYTADEKELGELMLANHLLKEFVCEMIDHGTRHDVNPTMPLSDDKKHIQWLYAHILSMDTYVREKAKRILVQVVRIKPKT